MGSTRPNPTHVGWVELGWTYVMGWVGLKNPLNLTHAHPYEWSSPLYMALHVKKESMNSWKHYIKPPHYFVVLGYALEILMLFFYKLTKGVGGL